jgi:hypothetical protein
MGIGSSIPDRKVFGFFRRPPAIFHRKKQEFGQKIPEKSAVLPTRNTASKFHRFPELFDRIPLVSFDLEAKHEGAHVICRKEFLTEIIPRKT